MAASSALLARRWAASYSSRAFSRSFSATPRYLAAVESTSSAAAASPPPPSKSDASPSTSSSKDVSKPTSPKIDEIVNQIAGLTLLEAADLVDALKTRLNISDVPLPVAAAAPAAPAAASPEDADAAAAAAEAAKPKEKTVFTIKLTKIDAAQKAKVIKEVKQLRSDMNLMQAKAFVESLPQTLKENSPKEDTEKLKKALEAVGATVSVE